MISGHIDLIPPTQVANSYPCVELVGLEWPNIEQEGLSSLKWKCRTDGYCISQLTLAYIHREL